MFLSGPNMGIHEVQSLERYDDEFSLRLKIKNKDDELRNGSAHKKNIDTKNKQASTQLTSSTQSTNSSTSLNYDADSDSSEPELLVPKEWTWELKCQMCNLVFSSPFEETFRTKSSNQSPKKEKENKKKNFRNKIKEKGEKFNPIVGGINFDEYKDASHKMDKFDPNCERVWTLEYFNRQYSPKLSKIIIGRGHRNEFPELNSIHLISEMRDTKETEWRNNILSALKEKSQFIQEEYNLIPNNEICQFCFYESMMRLNELRRCNKPFRRDNQYCGDDKNEPSGDNHIVSNGVIESEDTGVYDTKKHSNTEPKFDLFSKFRSSIRKEWKNKMADTLQNKMADTLQNKTDEVDNMEEDNEEFTVI